MFSKVEQTNIHKIKIFKRYNLEVLSSKTYNYSVLLQCMSVRIYTSNILLY